MRDPTHLSRNPPDGDPPHCGCDRSALLRSAAGGVIPSGTDYAGAFLEVASAADATGEPTVIAPAPTPTAPLRVLTSPGPATPTRSLPVWTSGPYRVHARTALHSTLDYLLDSPYAWVLERLTRYDIQVMFAESTDYWGAYSSLEQVIRINTLLSRAAPETIGAVLLHEALHATDHAEGRLGSSNECVSTERAAAEQVVEYWRALYGWSGKIPPENSFEAQINAMLAAYRHSRVEFDAAIRQLYRRQWSA